MRKNGPEVGSASSSESDCAAWLEEAFLRGRPGRFLDGSEYVERLPELCALGLLGLFFDSGAEDVSTDWGGAECEDDA